MTFPDFLRAQVERLGANQSNPTSAGEQLAASVCGTTDRTIRRWASGVSVPSKAEQAGAQLLLLRAKPIPGPRGKRKASPVLAPQ